MDNYNYDAIIIGSGIGGLTTAALLSKFGKKVLVLEKHWEAGGFTHMFKRGNYKWDVGLHYVGQVHKQENILNKAFNYITNGQLKWEPLGEVYDKAVFGSKEYTFVSGWAEQKKNLKTYFPKREDQESIDKYFELLDDFNHLGSGYYIEKALSDYLPGFISRFLRKDLLRFADRTTLEVLTEITQNKELIGVLTAQYGNYGLPPSESSFYMHAMVVSHYMNGAAYPHGGAASIVKTIRPVIEASRGKIEVNKGVDQILVEGNKVKGVRLENGEELYTDLVISNTGAFNTFLNLLPKELSERYHYKEKLSGLHSSTGHLGLYVGLKESAKTLNLPKHNYWLFSENYDHDVMQKACIGIDSPIPVSYISFPSAKDPEWDKNHPNSSTIEVIILSKYEWFDQWKERAWKKRGEDYEVLKEKLAQRLLKELYRVLPQLRGKIDFYELSTPLSTKKFSSHPVGEIYGLAHTPERFRNELLKPSTPIKGLYLCGQDVLICGIGGALMSGVLTASTILKKNLLSHIQKQPSS